MGVLSFRYQGTLTISSSRAGAHSPLPPSRGGSCWDAPRAQAGAAQPAAATMRSPASVRRPTPLPSIRKGPEAAARGAISSIGPHVVAFAPSFQGVST